MSPQNFLKLLRSRWLIVCITAAVAVLGAVVVTYLTTPLYQASTTLFVSTPTGEDPLNLYDATLNSQQRVISYTELVMGETLAQRTIDKLGLNMSAKELQSRVKATTKQDTVLIDVDVRDESPVRARDIANTLSDEFVAMVGELETTEDGSRPAARVVVEQRASIPDKPVVPQPTINIALGLALGLALGIGLAVIRHLLDNTVKERQTLEEITGAGLVTTIPFDKELRKKPTVSFDKGNSAVAEAFRKLRTNLQFLAVDNPPRLIVVGSAMPNEGKSTTAINIALALAEAEHNVVLVDGDMRRPMLSKYLNVVGSAGFSTVLSGRATLSEVLQKTSFPGLTVLASGPIPPNPSELLGSLAAEKLLSELRAQFDYVIVDSSPLLVVTDAAILAANSDGVLVVARFGQTKREQLAHAMRNLQDVGASALGAIFTMAPTRGRASYYSYGYGYYGEDKSRQPSSTSRPTPPPPPPPPPPPAPPSPPPSSTNGAHSTGGGRHGAEQQALRAAADPTGTPG